MKLRRLAREAAALRQVCRLLALAAAIYEGKSPFEAAAIGGMDTSDAIVLAGLGAGPNLRSLFRHHTHLSPTENAAL